jgi:hypothetical protein
VTPGRPRCATSLRRARLSGWGASNAGPHVGPAERAVVPWEHHPEIMCRAGAPCLPAGGLRRAAVRSGGPWFAELDLERSREQNSISMRGGHYARPDVCQLTVNEQPLSAVRHFKTKELPMSISTAFQRISLVFSIAATVAPSGAVHARTAGERTVTGIANGMGAATADAVYGCFGALGLTGSPFSGRSTDWASA